ncbi:MAG TPA: hypothetical protein VMK65_02705, partial [Longimicrobiales bacterium]|nr:hypothetical protein [Longimicrobiales bacterium]
KRSEVQFASITLRSDHTCTFSMDFIETEKATGETREDTFSLGCTYQLSGSTLTMDFGDGVVDAVTLEGDTITVDSDGTAWVFRR